MAAENTDTTLDTRSLPGDRNARHFEDYPAGMVVECGPISVNEGEIIAFGRQFDPQPFHVDARSAGSGV